MRYIRVLWHHEHSDEPVELFSEIDDARWEVRKIERFCDGTFGWADDDSAGSTRLGLEPVPSLTEIARSAAFQPGEIRRDEFERAWVLARGAERLGAIS